MDLFANAYCMFLVAIVGLCLGSFYNVVILRSLSGESIVFPPSKCPRCGHKLYAWHNIPLISYIFLRGKCYFCHEKISLQYPLIELATMLLFLFSYFQFGLTLKCLFNLVVVSLLLIMTMTDMKEKIVDCNLAIALGIVGLIYNHSWNSVLGLMAGLVVLEGVASLGYFFKKGRAMGEADTYVAAALGACFGLTNIGYVLLYSLVSSMLFIVPNFLYNQYKNNNKGICSLFLLFILVALLFLNFNQSILFVGLLILLGIVLIIQILKCMHQETKMTYLPYIPAFFLGTLYFLFF
jgi:prepilin signal peptidase PulO-like enzyme (type II secretory pathway)